MKIKFLLLLLFIYFFKTSAHASADSLQLSISKRLKENDKSLTISELQEALRFYTRLNDSPNEAFMLINLCRFYCNENLDSSLVYYSRALSFINRTSARSALLKLYSSHNLIVSKLSDSIPLLQKQKANTPKNSVEHAFICEKLAQKYYEPSPNKALTEFKEAIDSYKSNNDRVNIGFCYNNGAFVYQEILKDNKSALVCADKGLEVWRELKDTMNEANMLKYEALLYSKLHNYTKGILAGHLAIQKYSDTGNQMGVNVAYFDIANVYKEMNVPDSAIYYLTKAKTFWKTMNGDFRIFGINNLLARIYLEHNKKDLGQEMLSENLKLDSDNMYWQTRLEFYKTCIEHYSKMNDDNKAAIFKKESSQS